MPRNPDARLVAAASVALVALTWMPGGRAADRMQFLAPDHGLGEALAAAAETAGAAGAERGHRARNLTLLGHLGPEHSAAFAPPNADVWALGGFAYVGTTGSGSACAATGIKVVDVSDPTDPRLVGTLPSEPGTAANDVKALRVDTAAFQGDLLVHSDEPCAPGGFAGISLWDVSDPHRPSLLARFAGGPVHNLWAYQRGARAFVLAAVSFAEVFAPPGPLRADLWIVEVTDPRQPALVGTWTIGRDAGLAYGTPFLAGVPELPAGADCTPPPGTPELCRGQFFPGVYLHDVSVSANGRRAYLSYWDAGLVLLDISDPAAPAFLGRGVEPPTFGSDEGDAHAAVPARGGNLTLVTDETFLPDPWGFLRIFDTSDPAHPVQIGAFATERALGGQGSPFDVFSIHNVEVRGSSAYLSWYTDGIRVVDVSRPHAPREIASFVVEGAPSLFWGIHVRDELILASDILNGLFILKHVPPALERPRGRGVKGR